MTTITIKRNEAAKCWTATFAGSSLMPNGEEIPLPLGLECPPTKAHAFVSNLPVAAGARIGINLR